MKTPTQKRSEWSITPLVCACLLFAVGVYDAPAQVNMSDAFQKTLKRIAKERIKSEVVSWITAKDPISGITARDLISQILDGRDEQTILRSTTNVVTTMLFLGGIKVHVEALVDSNPGILVRAGAVGWSREQLVGYSCLYYYYSERLKRGLYVSPSILKMQEEKSRIEMLEVQDGKRWTTSVSARLVGLRGTQKDLSVDVRLLEVLDKSLWLCVTDRGQALPQADSMITSLLARYGSDDSLVAWTNKFRDRVGREHIIDSLFGLYLKPYTDSYASDNVFVTAVSQATEEHGTEPQLEASRSTTNFPGTSNVLVTAYSGLVATGRFAFVEEQQFRSIVLGIVRDLLEEWMSRSRQDGWKVEYVLSLAGTGLMGQGSGRLDFTVLDQIRLAKHFESTQVFAYLGGFIDPLLKNTINDSGEKVYLSGVGFGWTSFYLAVSVGLGYPEFSIKNTRLGISLGYEIPITDVLD